MARGEIGRPGVARPLLPCAAFGMGHPNTKVMRIWGKGAMKRRRESQPSDGIYCATVEGGNNELRVGHVSMKEGGRGACAQRLKCNQSGKKARRSAGLRSRGIVLDETKVEYDEKIILK